MKIKTKLLTMVSLMALTAVMLVVGVWALKTVNFTIDGNLSYIAPGIEATISKGTVTNGVWVNAGDASTKMPLTQITRTDTEETLTTKFSYWQNINLNFNEAGDDIKITFSITNNSTSKYIILDVSTSYTSADNCTISVDTTSKTLDPQGSHTFTLTMAVTDKTANATMTNFAVVFNMQLSDTKPVDLKWYDPDGHTEGNDSDGDGYYYVELGTYGGSAVRWRLVGVKGTGATETTRFDATTMSKPTNGQGTFVLETLIDYNAVNYVFDETNYANDYSNSDIRTYLTKESTGGYIYDVLGITAPATDAIYSAIAPRSITDLHTDIGWATGNVGGGQQYAPPAGTTQYATYDTTPSNATGADKLWLMSVKEIYTMVGGGTLTNGTIPSDWSSVMSNTDWDADSYDDYYWLRSPYPGSSDCAFYVYDGGDCYDLVVELPNAVRPAFNLNF